MKVWTRKFTFKMCVPSHPSHRPSKSWRVRVVKLELDTSYDVVWWAGAGQELVGSDGILYLKLADGRLESSRNHSLARCHQFAVGTWHFRELMVSMKCVPRRNWHRWDQDRRHQGTIVKQRHLKHHTHPKYDSESIQSARKSLVWLRETDRTRKPQHACSHALIEYSICFGDWIQVVHLPLIYIISYIHLPLMPHIDSRLLGTGWMFESKPGSGTLCAPQAVNRWISGPQVNHMSVHGLRLE